MTLLVSWVGVDTHGTSSAYIAADSRFTWGGNHAFDCGRKVFAFDRYPDILGFCGDVLFPSIVLGQITEMADSGLLFRDDYSCKQKFEAIKSKLVQLFNKYPNAVASITANVLQVLHVSREPDKAAFFCHLIEWRRNSGWSGRQISIPDHSGMLESLGSGAPEFRRNLNRYKQGATGGTCRAVFHCFCDTLFNTKSRTFGGAPQLVGLYRKPGSTAVKYGIIRKRKRYFLGAEVGKLLDCGRIEWRNDLFELCNGRTMKRLDGAMEQPDPLKRR